MTRPWRWSALGLLVIGVGVARAEAAWTDALFPESRHDFGMVPRGVKVKHDFLIVNRLGDLIPTRTPRASCGCTSARASARSVAPGQSVVIEAEVDTRNFVGPKSTVL